MTGSGGWRGRPRAAAVRTLGGLVVVLALATQARVLWSTIVVHERLVLAFLVAVVVGEVARLRMPSGRLTAPLASAAALGLAFVGPVDGEPEFVVDPGFVMLLAATGLLLAAGIHRLRAVAVGVDQAIARLLGVSIAALLVRDVAVQGTTVWDLLVDPQVPRPLVALALVVVSGVALALELVVTSGVRAEQQRARWATALRDEVGEVAPLTYAVVASGPMVALMAPSFGLTSLPAALFPLAITYVAVARHNRNRTTYRQTIATLAHLTERGGYTPPGHAERVSVLSVRIGLFMGMSAPDLRVLEYAALLHDLGQISLNEPIPRGATVLAAPGDQRDIALEGARIVRHAEGLDAVADAIEGHATPYRQVREHGQDVPLASRVIKVANAFDDLTAGEARSPETSDAALERLHLGLGYEYDPSVVDALGRVLASPVAGRLDLAGMVAR